MVEGSWHYNCKLILYITTLIMQTRQIWSWTYFFSKMVEVALAISQLTELRSSLPLQSVRLHWHVYYYRTFGSTEFATQLLKKRRNP